MQNAHGIRPHQYGRSHLQQGRRLFEDFRLETELPQRQRRRQAANATANNSDSHQFYWPSVLLLVELPARIQIIEVENRIEDQRITSRRLSSPERIQREQDDVTALERRIDYRRMLRNLVAAVEQSRNQEVARIAPTHYHSRPLHRRNQANQIAALLFIDGRGFPGLARGRRLGKFCRRPALDYIRIIDGASAGEALRPAAAATAASAAAAARDVADIEDWSIETIDRK